MSFLDNYHTPITKVTTRSFAQNDRPLLIWTLTAKYGGVHGWLSGLEKDAHHLSWFFQIPKSNPNLKMRLFYFMGSVNYKSREREFYLEGYGQFTPEDRIYAHSMMTADILNPENGWLKVDGSFSTECTFYVESMDTGDGVWRFNFYQYSFDEVEKGQNLYLSLENGYGCISRSSSSTFILLFLSNVALSSHLEPTGTLRKITSPIRIVVIPMMILEKYEILRIAHRYGFRNVVRYCENQLIQDHNLDFSPEDVKFQWAFTYGLNRYLLHLLKTHNIKLDSFGKVLILWNFREMSAEAMKLIVKKFLYEES